MMSSIEELIAGWSGEGVLSHYAAEHDTWMFIAVHDTRLGPACGGTRMRVYESPAAGLRDAMRLAEGMTLKNAAAGLPTGGGKAVLAVPSLPAGTARTALMHRYGELIGLLSGNYRSGPDMNTTGADMDLICDRTPYAFGRSAERGGHGSSAPDTAVGVWHGIRAGLAHTFGTPEPAGRRIVVEGVGGVGGPLVEMLVKDGADVLITDIDRSRIEALAHHAGVTPVDGVAGVECDVYAPCATGNVISEAALPTLRCRIVAGAANNQLATPADAQRVRDAGILYAPDFVINSGGALHLIGLELLGWDEPILTERLAAIGHTLTEIFAHADREGTTTEAAAEAVARARLDAAPAR